MHLCIGFVRLGHWGVPTESMYSAGFSLGGRHCEKHSSGCTALLFEETVNFKESYFAWSGLTLFEFP